MKQYYLDTNILLRFFLQDDEPQNELIKSIFEDAKNGKCECTISILLFVEMVFVLSRIYRWSNAEISEKLLGFLDIPYIDFEKREIVKDALKLLSVTKVSFIDLLLYVEADKTGKILATFDKKLQKLNSQVS